MSKVIPDLLQNLGDQSSDAFGIEGQNNSEMNRRNSLENQNMNTEIECSTITEL